MSIQIIGVRIDTMTKNEALGRLTQFVTDEKQHTVFTPNPEMIVQAQHDEYFKRILNDSDLNICDGKGIELVSKHKVERFPGVDVMQEVCRMAAETNKSVYLLGSRKKEVIVRCVEKLKEAYPTLRISEADVGISIVNLPDHRIGYNTEANDALVDRIILAAPDILFVAFGHGKQEKWIAENLTQLPSVRLAIGVGGAFDFIAGRVMRAPGWMRRVGLEWLWRLGRQPWRVKRIWNATVVFLLYVFIDRIKTRNTEA